MKTITMQHTLGNKILEYDVNDEGIIIDEREVDKYSQSDGKNKKLADWVKLHIVFHYDIAKSGATNESLKASPYLEDLSGNNRPLQLFNFLFNDSGSGISNGALMTDGVDDHALVANYNSGVKMLFYTFIPTRMRDIHYDQRKVTSIYRFALYNDNPTAYAARNDGRTYINGVLNTTINSFDLLNVKHTATLVNEDSSLTIAPVLFAANTKTGNFALSSFYNAIGFDEIPTEADGITELEVIDYVIENLIEK